MLTESGILLRAGVKHKYINSLNCLEYLKEVEYNKKMGLNDKDIKDLFVNKSVMCNYGKFRIHKITDIIFDSSPATELIEFRTKENVIERISLSKYYEIQYKKKVSSNQFLFISENKQHQIIHLIPELCVLTGMSEDARNNTNLKREMLKISNIDANRRIEKTLEVRDFFSYNKQVHSKTTPYDICQKWGLKIRPTIEKFEGRYIKNPDILFKDGIAEFDTRNGKFRTTRINVDDKFLIDEYSMIIFGLEYNDNKMNKLLSNLKNSSKSIGIRNENIERSKKVLIRKNNIKEWEDAVKEVFSNPKHKDKFAIVVVDSFSKSYYNSLKDCFKMLGVLSQFVQIINIEKPLAVASKIFMQIVAKMNKRLYTIKIDETFQKSPSCIVGIESNNKYVSMVMTYDQHLSLYFSAYKEIEGGGSEKQSAVGNIIQELLIDLLMKFKQRVNCFPNKMFIYRSGTNESGIQRIVDFESPKIEFVMDKYCPETQYLVCVSITKQDLKLFTQDPDNKTKYKYPKFGLVVDSGITKTNSYEFYLQPCNESGIPTYYKVILLKGLEKMPMEILQKITYYLCYYFWNWNSSIKVPTCLKFAEKQLCQIFDSKCNVHSNLYDKAYYI